MAQWEKKLFFRRPISYTKDIIPWYIDFDEILYVCSVENVGNIFFFSSWYFCSKDEIMFRN